MNERYGSNFNNQYDPNSRYGTNNNNNGYLNNFNVNDGYNNQNPYDIEYERRIRVETEKLRQLLLEIDKKHSSECTLNVATQWNFETNVNEVSQLEAVSENYLQIRFSKSGPRALKLFKKFSSDLNSLLKHYDIDLKIEHLAA